MSDALHNMIFDARLQTRLIFGENSVEKIGSLANELSENKRILLVTDPGLVAAGHAAKVTQLLEAEKYSVILFDQTKENPTTADVDACLQVAQKSQIDLIIALGGGSSLDTAKGCNFILTNGQTMQDYQGYGKATQPLLPLIAIPTTAGTGSECQSYALIVDETTHEKMACGDPKAAPRIALLDPVLTLTQPYSVTIASGIDALTHALETAVTTKRNSLSSIFSREAFRLIANYFGQVLTHPEDLYARSQMQLAAAYSGLAVENSMLGAAHAAANPLTARYGLTHGLAVGLMIVSVIRYNSHDPEINRVYAELARNAGLAQNDQPDELATHSLLKRLSELLQKAQLSQALEKYDIDESVIKELSQQAAQQWTAQFNPRSLECEDFHCLYREAFCEFQLKCSGSRG